MLKYKKNHISLSKIFSEYSYNDGYWLEIIKKYYEPEAQFLYLLTPCINYIYEKINLLELKNYILLDQDAKDIILRRFKNYWLHKIMMCCVLELSDAKELNLLTGNTPEKRFEDFIMLLADNNNRLAFFDKYVVLRDKLKKYMVKELEALTDILTRLDKCFAEILSNFSWNQDRYELKYIQSAGDSHASKNVCILALHNSKREMKKIVYKPRSLGMDKAYHEFLAWLNSYLKFPLYNPKILLKKEYGWCEFINNLPCKNEKQIKEYCQNLGNLLAIVYLFCGSDIHYENIIAYGKHPVIIDVECFFVPHNILRQNSMPFLDKIYSVLSTLILPCRVLVKKDAEGIDVSGFANHANQEVPYQAIVAEKSGTDNIHLVRKTLTTTRQNNVPRILDKQVNPVEYEKYVTVGFNEAYSIFLKKKKQLLSQENLLLSFKKVRTRLVFRPTSEYVKLLVESYHPLLLSKKISYRKHFSEWLRNKKTLAFLHESEIEQCLEGDIPAFYAKVSSKDKLEDASLKKIDAKFMVSGYLQVINHIENNINKNDLKMQNALIEQSFLCHRKNSGLLLAKSHVHASKKITSEETLRNVNIILNEMLVNVWQRGDLLFWPQAYPIYDTWNPGVSTPWMYDGLVGITLVFGVAAYVLKNKLYHQFAIKCLRVIELYILEFSNQEKNIPIGVFSGVGGILYLIHILSSCQIKYDHEKIKNQCFVLLEKHIPCMKLVSVDDCDIISGMAGLVKILVNFKNTSDESRAFALAKIGVQQLLNTYPDPSIFPKRHIKNDELKQPLLGFSHGVSGIAWALYDYYLNVKKSKKIYVWIKHALDYERQHFSSKNQNWPNFRNLSSSKSSEGAFPVKWCHGAVGIGLSRIDMYRKGWRDQYILNEIKSAVQTTLFAQALRDLNLCHGSLGNLEFLTFALQNGFLIRTEYDNYFRNLVPYLKNPKNMIAEIHEGFCMNGLMTGKAGVAYGLLKIVHSGVPSTLLLDKINK